MGQFKDNQIDIPIDCTCIACVLNAAMEGMIAMGMLEVLEVRQQPKPKTKQYGNTTVQQATSQFYEEARKRGLIK